MRIIFCSRIGNRYWLALLERLLVMWCILLRFVLEGTGRWLTIREFIRKLWPVAVDDDRKDYDLQSSNCSAEAAAAALLIGAPDRVYWFGLEGTR